MRYGHGLTTISTSMKNSRLLLTLPLAFASTLAAAEPNPGISAASILARTKVLSSDEFEGRAPGSAGEEKTVNYLVGEFKKLGLKPGNPDGSYTQSVPLVGITTILQTTFTTAGGNLEPQPITEYVARTRRVAPKFSLPNTEMVFCGYGVVAPEYAWDDFK